MDTYTQSERIEIVIDIVKQLTHYSTNKGNVNLYNDTFSYVQIFKKISNDYIKNERDYKVTLDFLEIGKKIKYYLPIEKKNKSYFIMKMK